MSTLSIIDKVLFIEIEMTVSPHTVWKYLTTSDLLKLWMLDESMQLDIQTTWKTDSPFTMCGNLHDIEFKNTGTVLINDVEKHLRYSQLSSISHLTDCLENHAVIDFQLFLMALGTRLEFRVSNCVNVEIYKHHEFYWKTTLWQLKKEVEKRK
jgi:hypothetical protein